MRTLSFNTATNRPPADVQGGGSGSGGAGLGGKGDTMDKKKKRGRETRGMWCVLLHSIPLFLLSVYICIPPQCVLSFHAIPPFFVTMLFSFFSLSVLCLHCIPHTFQSSCLPFLYVLVQYYHCDILLQTRYSCFAYLFSFMSSIFFK